MMILNCYKIDEKAWVRLRLWTYHDIIATHRETGVYQRKKGLTKSGSCKGRALQGNCLCNECQNAADTRFFYVKGTMAKKHTDGLETSQVTGEKTASQFGYELVGASMDKEPAGLYLRFFLDKPGGITLDDCERFHREIQPQLENVEYDFLEVCSPGLDRPIKTDWDARKAMGEMVEVRLYKPVDGRKTFTGTFKGLTEEGYTIETEQGEMSFPKKAVALARRVIDLSILDDETIIEQEVGYEQP